MRIQGSAGVAPIECINPRKDKWRVRWDIQQTDEAATYEEAEFDHRPSVEEVRATIIAWHNARIKAQITEGFRWEGVPVWLSTENQFNYKSAFDVAIQTQGANLPVVFKLGTDDTPVYREFRTVDELKSFCIGVTGYIQKTLAEGWKCKDAIDFSIYQK